MVYAYPCDITLDEDGELIIAFPDLPEAIAGGQDRGEALGLAADALSAALAGYVHDQRDVPQPSIAASGQELIAVPAVMTAKLALYSTMRSQNITESDLAGRLGSTRSAVRKLTDPERRPHIGQLQEALDAVGCQLVIDVTAA